MKSASLLVIIFIFFSFTQNNSSESMRERAERIRNELLNSKSLSATIIKPMVSDNGTPLGRHLFYYHTTRREDNKLDSVTIQIEVNDEGDSFHSLFLAEAHWHIGADVHSFNGDEAKSYVYDVDKHGMIDWAYYTNPPTAEPTEEQTPDGGTIASQSNQPIVEINTNVASKIWPVKIPNEKIREKYMTKLKVTLDELDSILFKK